MLKALLPSLFVFTIFLSAGTGLISMAAIGLGYDISWLVPAGSYTLMALTFGAGTLTCNTDAC